MLTALKASPKYRVMNSTRAFWSSKPTFLPAVLTDGGRALSRVNIAEYALHTG
jgi:hypothetical protein